MKLGKIIAMLLALLTLTSAAASCTDTSDVLSSDESSDDTSAASVTDTPEVTPNYLTLEADFEGADYRVLTIENTTYQFFSNFEVFSEGENGDIVNDAVYRRNRVIEDKFNVNIKQIPVNDTNMEKNTEMLQAINKNIMANDDICELFFIALRDAGSVIQNGFALDLKTLPHVDFSQPYWNAGANDMLSINDKLYLTTSDFSLVDKKRTYILVYNRDMLKQYSDYNLEELVDSGEWTFDKLVELCESVSTDLNGDGLIDNNDQWGVGMDGRNGLLAFATGMGGILVSKDSDGMPINNSLSERLVNIADKMYSAFNENKTNAYHCYQYQNWKMEGYERTYMAETLFKNGDQLFATCFPQTLPTYSSVETLDYGITLWPKYDESQERYYTFADTWGSVLFGVPYINANKEMNGIMLEALSGYSTDTTLKAYYEISCKVKYTYDETSARMLDMALAGLTFDLGAIFNWGDISSKAFMYIAENTSNTYVSDLEAIRDQVDIAIKETLDAIENNQAK